MAQDHRDSHRIQTTIWQVWRMCDRSVLFRSVTHGIMAGLEAYKNLLVYGLHLIIYSLLSAVQFVLWRLNGVSDHLSDIDSGRTYDQSAQLLKVWSQYRIKIACIHYRRHFISTHAEFVHPDYALQEHVTLMTVTDKEAIFSVSEKTVNSFDVRAFPFLFDSLFCNARYLLVMPISSFLTLGEKQGDPVSKVIWIHHTGRCGSTALSQAFSALPDTVSLSEPHCLFALRQTFKRKHLFTKTNWQVSQEYKSIFQSSVRLILKPNLKQAADIFVVKAVPMNGIAHADLLYEMFPNFSQIFMYRDAAPQITSIYRCISGHDLIHDITLTLSRNPVLSRIFPTVMPLQFMYCVCDERTHSNRFILNCDLTSENTTFIGLVINWAELCFHYKELAASRFEKNLPRMPAFKFEHMRADLHRYLTVLFAQCQLQLTPLRSKLFLEALEVDSQMKSYVSRDKVAQKKIEITADMIDEANKYLTLYGMSAWGETTDLEGTVTQC